MLKIVTVPNKVLNTSVQPVIKIDKKIKDLIAAMEKTLVAQSDPQGVGLAAPQVGENLALFIIRPAVKAKIEVFINPKIIKTLEGKPHSVPPRRDYVRGKKKAHTKLEGCLSIPRIWSPIKRPQRILLEYQDIKGASQIKWFFGFEAVIIQHEMDHLKGILFTQRSLEQNASMYEEKEGKLQKLEY